MTFTTAAYKNASRHDRGISINPRWLRCSYSAANCYNCKQSMTLILVVANIAGVYQSSDYQLTDQKSGAPISDRAGSKQLEASFKDFDIRLAFTGIAAVGLGATRQSTIDSLSGELKGLPHDANLQDICDALSRRSAAITKGHGLRGVLEIVLTISAVDEPFRIAVVTNIDWRKRPPEAKAQFSIRIHKITKPFHLISGYRDSVSARQQHRLQALARDIGKRPPDHVRNALARINAKAAEHGRGYVSEGCWVTSQIADGRVRRSAGLNVGQHEGDVPLLHGGIDLFKWIRENFRAEPGKEIRIVQNAGARYGPGDAIPSPPPSGKARRFKLSGASVVASLLSPKGTLCGSVRIAQSDSVVEMRCNEEAILTFATVEFSGFKPMSEAFPRPLLPWPQLSYPLKIDDAEVPRGCVYSVGYWIEAGVHRVVIPQSSRSIRNVAFLGPDDEMIIVAPSSTLEFSWSPCEQAPSATMQARVSWRSRFDGTTG